MGRAASLVVAALAAALVAAAPAARPLRPFTFVARAVSLDFLPYGEYAPVYTALAKGWYREEGLDVSIRLVVGSAEAIGRVAAGEAHAGAADFSALTAARANERLPVRAIAAYYRRPPHAIFVRADAGIRAPKDLEGRRLATTRGNSHQLFFPLFAEAAGFRADAVSWVTMDAADLAPALFEGRVDGIPFFAHHEGRLAGLAVRRGTAVKRLSYADYGMDTYSLVIVAREEAIGRDGEPLRAFLRATIRGIRYAFAPAHHREAARLALKAASPSLELEAVADAAAAASRFVLTDELAPGQFEPARVTRSRDLYARVLRLTRTVPAEELYTDALLPERR